MRNPYENNTDKTNIEAQNSIINGFLFSVPASLIGGFLGGVTSIIAGIFIAKDKSKNQKNIECNNIKQVNKVYDRYENVTYEQLCKMVADRFNSIDEISKSSLLVNSKVINNTKDFLRTFDKMCDAKDFRTVYLSYTRTHYDIGFFANGNYYFMDKTTASFVNTSVDTTNI